MYFLLRNGGALKEKRNYWILGVSGMLIMFLSFLRIPIYNAMLPAVKANNYLIACIYSFTIANPYPLLPYLAYGLFGSLLALMVSRGRKNLILKIMLPLGFVFLIYGIVGVMNFPKTISTPDYFWYFKTHFELGIFLLIMIFFIFVFESKGRNLRRLDFIQWFSRIGLTIYMLETFVSEILRKILLHYIPSWNQTINGCLMFGVFNIFLWVGILYLWRQCDFRYSLEYWWVQFFNRIGKTSTKMDNLY